MSKPMRAKMTVQSIHRQAGMESVQFNAQYSNTPEDNSYSKATPSGSINLTITNPDLVGAFSPGDQFYVDFTPIAKS